MSRPINAIPLDPTILVTEGAVDRLPQSDAAFDPRGEWDHTFLVIGSRGYQTEHQTVGLVRIRKRSLRPDSFSLQIDERILGDRGTESRQDISVDCLNDSLATPLSWKRRFGFFNPQGEPEPDLSIEEEGTMAGGIVEIHCRGRTKRIALPGNWTTQYNLLEAIQRLIAADHAVSQFDLLEDFCLLKPKHLLVRADVSTAELPGIGSLRLQRYAQTGYGLLPIDYYLDERNRLLFVISMNKTLVLSSTDHAAQVIDANLARRRRGGRRG
jgi:hypothetical protein